MSIFTDSYNAYTNRIPGNTQEAMAHSFVLSCIGGTLFSGKIEVGIACGVMGAIAAAISGITMPLFRNFIPDEKGDLRLVRNGIIRFVAILMTQIALKSVTHYRLNLLFSLVATVSFGVFKGMWEPSTSCPTIVIV